MFMWGGDSAIPVHQHRASPSAIDRDLCSTDEVALRARGETENDVLILVLVGSSDIESQRRVSIFLFCLLVAWRRIKRTMGVLA
jgi:hypothetical protein